MVCSIDLCPEDRLFVLFFVSLIFFLCFPSYFVFSVAVLPHSPGVVYYHLLSRQETRIPGVAPFSFQIEIWDLFVHRGQKSYTPSAFRKLWTTPGVRCMKQCLIIIYSPSWPEYTMVHTMYDYLTYPYL